MFGELFYKHFFIVRNSHLRYTQESVEKKYFKLFELFWESCSTFSRISQFENNWSEIPRKNGIKERRRYCIQGGWIIYFGESISVS